MTLTVDDKVAIQELCARYYVSTDEKDVDGFMACWVDDDDISFESVFGNFKGHDQIRKFEDEHVKFGMAIGKRHLLGNVIVAEGPLPHQALVTSYLVVMEVVDTPKIVATAIYRDSVAEKTPHGWKFRKRSMSVDPGFQHLVQ